MIPRSVTLSMRRRPMRAFRRETCRGCGRSTAFASFVWSVEKTRCPVSAACIASSMVGRSRISPARITSGFLPQRRAEGRARC